MAPASASAATFNVNTTTDVLNAGACAAATPNECSLREAVVESNSTAPPTGQTNTINVPAGTYTLTQTEAKTSASPIAFDSKGNELDVENNPVSIIGAGAASTIIQPATSLAASSEMIFIINGYTDITKLKPLSASISGITMRFGKNPYDITGWGFGGALEYESGDGGQLTLSDDVFDQNQGPRGGGGAVAAFEDSATAGAGGVTSASPLVNVVDSTFTNNTSPNISGTSGNGGAIQDTFNLPITISNSTFTGNSAGGAGGAVDIVGHQVTPPAGTTPDSITGSTFTSNTAAEGGAVASTNNGLSVTNSIFDNNIATVTGGGLDNGSEGHGTTMITGSTFTNNAAQSTGAGGGADGGGGIENGNGAMTVTDSRITGNTTAAGATGSGIDQGADNTTDTVSATDDWWGCNAGPGQPSAGTPAPTPGAGCDSVADRSIGTHSFTTSPWVELRTSGSATVDEGGSSSLTTSFLKDSGGTTLTTSQIAELIGLPVSWTNVVHGAFSNQQTTIQSSGTATATLTNDGTCTNTTGQSKVDNVQTGDSLATATLTVQCPDLTAVKTDNVSGTTTLGNAFSWKVHVANSGQAPATFASGQTVLTDDLPSSGISYGTASIANQAGITGTLSCSIATSTLTCAASGGPVTIAAGTGAFDVSATATPTTAGSFANPRAAGVCAVDPANVISESNESNNGCSDTVVVTAPDLTATKTDDVSGATTLGHSFTWKVHVANSGSAGASFASGQTVLSDDLPSSGISYGAATIANQVGITGTVSCSIVSGTLSCVASGGSVTVAATTGAFDVSMTATPAQTGTFTNPRASGSCGVDPGGVVTESNESNNGCGPDSVVVSAPDLTATKTDDVSGSTTLGQSFTWKIHVANAGSAAASFADGQTVLKDDLPNSGISYGSASNPGVANLSCSIVSSTLSCVASGGPVTIASAGSFDVSFTATPSQAGSFANPRASGVCAVDPNGVITESDETNNACSDTVNVTGVDLTAVKTDDVSGATTLGNSFTWKIHVANGGVSDATFAGGQTVLRDDLPNSGVSYGAASIANKTGITGTVSCSIASSTLSCVASGSVTIAAGTGGFDVSLTATPSQTGTFANPRAAGVCAVDPANVISESNETNNGCSDSVVVTAPDLTATKTDDVSGATTLGHSFTWKIHVANSGSAVASFAGGQTVLSDDLPASGISYGTPVVSDGGGSSGTVSCAITSGTLSCTASGPVTIPVSGTVDVSVGGTPSQTGTFTNPRASGSCGVDPGGTVTESNESNNGCGPDSVVVSAPDLTATKTDDVSGSTTLGQSFTWKIHVANGGSAAASFADGQTVLKDDLPNSGISYAAASNPGVSNLSCAIASSTLTCVASGGTVTIASAGSFDVSFKATPSQTGSFANPRAAGTCAVDPNGVITESDETNNACGDTVTVTAPDLTATKTDDVRGAMTLGGSFTWKIHVANSGSSGATFAPGQTVLRDDLPSSGITYGSVVSSAVPNLSCSIASSTLSCVASGGPATIASGGSFDVSFGATPSQTGTFANPRTSGVCAVDPDGMVVETNESNNACSDTVVVVAPDSTAPDLTATNADDVNGSTTLGHSFSWKVHVANSGSAPASFSDGQTVLSDDLPSSGIAYGSVVDPGVANLSCSINASDTLSCVASGGQVTIASGGSFDVAFGATPSQTGTFTSPRASGSCAVDPGNVIMELNESNNGCGPDSVTVSAPDLTATKTDDVSGATTLGSSFTWKIRVANSGSSDATFTDGQTVLRDDLPNSGISYGPVVDPGVPHLSCSIASSTLTCVASGGPVTIASAGSFDVSFTATPSQTGSFSNPRASGVCAADPNGVISESQETNNACSDIVNVTAPDLTATKTDDVGGATTTGHQFRWTIEVANAGDADATFASGQRILVDDLPAGQIGYGPVPPPNGSDVSGPGSVACTITFNTLTCTASGGAVTLPAAGTLTVSIPATAGAAGAFTNPRPGGSCEVNPDGGVTESQTGNNFCQDTVEVSSGGVGSAPPTVSLSTPADGSHYNLGQPVVADFSCQDGTGGPGLSSCVGPVASGSRIDTSTPGQHTFTVTGTSQDGLRSSVTHSYTVIGPPSVTISSPSNGLTFLQGQHVPTRFACTEAGGGPGLSSCVDSNGSHGPTGTLRTQRVGTFTYLVTAISRDGQRATTSVSYHVSRHRPDNRFQLTDLRAQPDGVVLFRLQTPGPGTVDVLETAPDSNETPGQSAEAAPPRGVAPNRFVFARAHSGNVPQGLIPMRIQPNGRGARLVAHHRNPVRIRLWITYTPAGGVPQRRHIFGLLITP